MTEFYKVKDPQTPAEWYVWAKERATMLRTHLDNGAPGQLRELYRESFIRAMERYATQQVSKTLLEVNHLIREDARKDWEQIRAKESLCSETQSKK